MSFYAIGEPKYKTSNWYKDTLDGLMNEKRQKRFTLTLLDNIDQLKEFTISSDDVIFVIGTNVEWLDKTLYVCECVFDNRVIVLGNHEKRLHSGKYSIVTSDIARNIQILYNYLKSHKKSRIAMYGINPQSASDAFRKESFLACGASENDLFYNSYSLSQCFEDFMKQIARFDAVICVNDYAAISLIRHLRGQTPVFITSCGGTLMANFFSPSITHIQVDYRSLGKTGLDLSRILQKNNNINSVSINLSGDFVAGETTAFLPLEENVTLGPNPSPEENDKYYSDIEISEMLRIETLLNSCDTEDLEIIDGILKDITYSAIAEKLFMSTNGVKYKLKNMFRLCNVNSKMQFVELLGKYIKTLA